jgi:Cu/Ag efflux protein CusF
MKSLIISITLLLLVAAAGANATEKSGPISGTIVGRDESKNQLTVDHGAVTAIMGAMTMSYEIRGQRVASLPKDGAKITATLHESSGAFWLTDVAEAEQHGGGMPGMQHHHMTDMQMKSDTTSDFLMRQASGTSANPAAAPMHMKMTMHGDWMLMWHGQAFVSGVEQTGPRGGDKIFSTNWVMATAERPLGGGHLMLRSMLSLEPLTVGHKYPELFQTGETIHHQPIVDAQHPHDFFMEIAAEYAHELPGGAIGYVYAAPVGDPALGPVGFPHRASAAEIPQAPLSHHVQDSTHIASSVLTLGGQRGMFGLAASGFHGREPDENRWDIDRGRIDSWSARATFEPTPNWSAQVSTGRLRHPEAAEPGNIQRTTASVSYSTATWHSSVIYGHNDRTRRRSANAYLAETVKQFGKNYVTARGEIVDKDELPVPARVRALTAGYTRGFVGGNVTIHDFPRALEPLYGRSPRSFYLFLRLRS